MIGYLVGESDSNITFAAIKDGANAELTEKMARATLEEFCYESVTPINEIKKSGNDIIQSFKCIGDGHEEIRDIKLSLTAIY